MEKSDNFAGGSAAPSGRLQVYEPKDFPYLNTGKSLVFVIARNGMVWGKRLDEQSSKGDIELEVFWPREDGCLVRQWGSIREWGGEGYGSRLDSADQYTLLTARKTQNVSVEQNRKIESILSQKEIIQYELGTLMVKPCPPRSHINCSHLMEYRRVNTEYTECMLQFPAGEPCNIKVVDCSFGEKVQKSTMECWYFFYDYASCEFKFFSNDIYAGGAKWQIGSLSEPKTYFDVQNYESVQSYATTVYLVAMASDKKFNFSRGRLFAHEEIKPVLRVMYGEFDFFDFFAVDDAFLMLEKKRFSDGKSCQEWTLGIAQNKHVREMMRLASNNPGLFAPLIPKQHREGGKKT